MLFKKKESGLSAVCDGEVIPMSEIPDDVFSKGILGIGYGIKPSNGIIVSPTDGIIEVITSTYHAYTVKNVEELQIIIHIGVDTVSLDGHGFKSFVSEGQRVKRGDVLCHCDLEYISSKGISTVTSVLITDGEKIENIKYEYGRAEAGKGAVMSYRRKE